MKTEHETQLPTTPHLLHPVSKHHILIQQQRAHLWNMTRDHSDYDTATPIPVSFHCSFSDTLLSSESTPSYRHTPILCYLHGWHQAPYIFSNYKMCLPMFWYALQQSDLLCEPEEMYCWIIVSNVLYFLSSMTTADLLLFSSTPMENYKPSLNEWPQWYLCFTNFGLVIWIFMPGTPMTCCSWSISSMTICQNQSW